VSDTATPTPASAWAEMVDGNHRFVAGSPEHPRQDAERRAVVAEGQAPVAALFGCSDSRLAAEIIFDLGLGDLFVVRNAGQVISDSVLGSLEYAVAVLKVPLIVVLRHDACGAVRAAIDSQGPDAPLLPAHIADLVSHIVPAVRAVGTASDDGTIDTEHLDADEVGQHHLRDTVGALLEQSELISAAVADGHLAVVGADYHLADGRVDAHVTIGDLARPTS
jgi:carbonic anhydrase